MGMMTYAVGATLTIVIPSLIPNQMDSYDYAELAKACLGFSVVKLERLWRGLARKYGFNPATTTIEHRTGVINRNAVDSNYYPRLRKEFIDKWHIDDEDDYEYEYVMCHPDI